MANIVVIGAGVSGLTSALQLARANKDYKIVVIARHMPGDYDIEYTSPWAGANVLPMNDKANSRWERDTWPELKRLAAEVPEAGIHFQKARVLRRKKDVKKAADRVVKTDGSKEIKLSDELFSQDPWFRTLFDDYRDLRADELPEDAHSGSEFTSVCINTIHYLVWLYGQCRKLGVVFRRVDLKHIADAAQYAGLTLAADGTTVLATPPVPSSSVIIVNCSGLLSYRLGGVADPAVQPARGQIVIIRNELTPMFTTTSTDDAPDELLYSMMRPAGGGTIVGGTYMVGNWESQPLPNIAARIVKRIVDTHPMLKGKTVADIDIIRHGVGLRPYRTGGVRIETETQDGPAGPLQIVHNYGHAGWGYQGSYGCAKRVVELVDEVAKSSPVKARL